MFAEKKVQIDIVHGHSIFVYCHKYAHNKKKLKSSTFFPQMLIYTTYSIFYYVVIYFKNARYQSALFVWFLWIFSSHSYFSINTTTTATAKHQKKQTNMRHSPFCNIIIFFFIEAKKRPAMKKNCCTNVEWIYGNRLKWLEKLVQFFFW